MKHYIFRRGDREGWTLKYQERSRRWRYRQFATKREAREHVDELLLSPAVKLDAGDRATLTLAEYAARWLEMRKPTLRLGTVELYAGCLARYILPALGETRPGDITRADVRDFLAQLLGRGLAKTTVRTVRGTLRCLLEEAIEDGLLAVNPAAGKLKALRLTVTLADRASKIRAFDRDQLRRFLAAAAAKLPERALLWRLQAATGLRPGEAYAAQWTDLDLERRQIHIRRSVSRRVVQGTKTGAERIVDLPASVVEDLRRHDVATKATALGHGDERAAWIFPSLRGTPLDTHQLERDFKRALAAAGLPGHFSPYSLRHTFASLHLQAGESIYYVQRQLGHRSIGLTVDLYGSWLPHGNPEAAERLDQRIRGER